MVAILASFTVIVLVCVVAQIVVGTVGMVCDFLERVDDWFTKRRFNHKEK